MTMTTCLSDGKKLIPQIDSREKTGPSVDANLANIVNELWHNPLEKR